jgi:hypothetical protein
MKKQGNNQDLVGFIMINSIIIAGLGAFAAFTSKKLVDQKTETIKKEHELEILKTNMLKMEDFLEWEIDYMEDKINLNMVRLKAEDMKRYGETELKEVIAQTKTYVENDILHSIRERTSKMRALIKQNEDER